MRWIRQQSRRTVLFYALLFVQLCIVSAVALSNHATVWWGKKIDIQTIPVDPRDILYGDFVILRYAMNTFDATRWKSSDPPFPPHTDPVYTVLSPEGAYYVPAGFYAQRPKAKPHEVILRGTIAKNDRQLIQYGIERYYVPEGTGLWLEQQAGALVATVAVAPWGQIRLLAVRPRP